MNQNFSELYEIDNLSGCCQLNYNPPYDIENARRAIDEINRKALELGYPASQWLIVKKQFVRVSDDGQFVMSTVIRTAVEKYPDSL